MPEFYLWACKLFKLQTPLKSSYRAAQLYGFASRRHLHDADIFHVRSGSGGAGAIERARREGMKVVVDHSIAHPAFMDRQLRSEYDKYGVTFDLGMDNPFWAAIVDECRKADVVLVNSQFVKDTFIENGFPANQLAVVMQGVRPDFFSLKQTYVTSGPLRILFTGGFGFRKGAEYILQALKELERLGIDYQMTVVGDYRGALPIIRCYQPKGINLVSTVPQDELKVYLAQADVYLFPSLCEGCASSGMEAMAAGLPVIATHESGLPIESGHNGLLIPSRNATAIVEAVTTLAANQALRQSLGATAAFTIYNNYTWEAYARNIFRIYQFLALNEKMK